VASIVEAKPSCPTGPAAFFMPLLDWLDKIKQHPGPLALNAAPGVLSSVV
jgi:hypothetical protein